MSILLLVSAAILSTQATAESKSVTYFGCYRKGVKVGYRHDFEEPGFWKGQKVRKETSEDVIWLAQGQVHEVDVSYSDSSGRPLHTESDVSLLAMNRHSVADYGPSSVSWSSKGMGPNGLGTVAYPADAPLSQDLASTFAFDKAAVDESHDEYEFEDIDHKFVKSHLVYRGKSDIPLAGKTVSLNHIEVDSNSGNSETFCDDKGHISREVEHRDDVVYVEETKDQAIAPPAAGDPVDFGDISMAPSKGKLKLPAQIYDTKLRLTGINPDMSLPTDDHQTATKSGDVWLLTVHEPHENLAAITIQEAAKKQPQWIKADSTIQSDAPEIVSLARQIVGKETTAHVAAYKIKQYVYKRLQYDYAAGFNQERTALQILKSGKGVCRDYAILSAALMRAAKIPVRLVFGAAGAQGADAGFYFHAWISVYCTTNKWVDMEVTGPNPYLSTCYVELGAGTYADANGFGLRDNGNLLLTILPAEAPAAQSVHGAKHLP